jgi:hypothetical protein
MQHFYENLGEKWFTYPKLYSSVVRKFPSNSHFVEVGTWKGMSAVFMAVEIINSKKDIRFDCVDAWDFVPSQKEIPSHMFQGLYEEFLKNIQPVRHKINPVRSVSWDGATRYSDNSLDFVFIDAAHDYDSVTKDIRAWFPKLKKAGVIAGHDYECPDVRKAVTQFFMDQTVYESEGCWIVDVRHTLV